MILYALHDALVKPMPGNAMAPSLAESWSVSKDGLVYEFVLRKGVKFHNGDPVTAEDVKFSFERYRGAAAQPAEGARRRRSRSSDPGRVRFRLKEPWPDFMTFYGTPATGAGWIVPKKYVEKVGDDGFKKAPVGAGPYRFVSFTPGIELVLEAFEQLLAQDPEREAAGLQGRAGRDHAPGHAQARRGRHRLSRSTGALAEEVQRTPGLTLKPTPIVSHALARLPRSVGSEVAVARPARAPGRQPRDRPAGHRTRPSTLGFSRDHRQHHPARASSSSGSRRPIPTIRRKARAAPGRGRLSERLRRRRLLVRRRRPTP